MRTLLKIVVAVAVLWSVAWFGLSLAVGPAIDRGVTTLARRGTTVTCPDRSVSGYPFAFRITCPRMTVSNRERTLDMPEGVTAEWSLAAPLDVVLRPVGTAVSADGNAHWENATLTLSPIHAPEDFRFEALNVSLRSNALPGPITLADIRSEGTARRDVDGLTGTLDHFTATASGGGGIALAGPFTVDRDGLLSGRITLGLADVEGLTRTVEAIVPGAARGAPGLALQAIPQMGAARTIGALDTRAIEIELDRGRGQLGFVPIRVPPLF